MEKFSITKTNKVRGSIIVPGDKSISHRAVIFGSIAQGKTLIKGFLYSEDCINTLKAFQNMGIKTSIKKENEIEIEGKGLYGLSKPDSIIDCGNSGTTMRLMAGVLAGQNFDSQLTGDESLSNRPMERIMIPLRNMNADISSRNDKYPPLFIHGRKLRCINYKSPVASAQVKSCVLLAGLYAKGITFVTEPYKSRDHSERMLKYMGAGIKREANKVSIIGGDNLSGKTIYVPGDISSAAYFIALALLTKGSRLVIKDIGLNPTRTGIISVLNKMGADISILKRILKNNEPRGDILITTKNLKAVSIDKRIMPYIIDEIPILALCMTQARGISVIKGAEELRVKESDRIKRMVSELNKMGANITEKPDGMIIKGPVKLKGTKVTSYKDHRVAMTLAIAGKIANGKTIVEDTACIKTSFPSFKSILDEISL